MDIHFALYKHHLVVKNNQIVSKLFIVLMYPDGTKQFTDFHKYIKSPKKSVRKYTESPETRFKFVIQLLNYAFFYSGIPCLDALTIDVVKCFLRDYGMCELPDDDEFTSREKHTVERCVSYIMDFLTVFISSRKGNCQITIDDLYKTVIKRGKHGSVYEKKVPVFSIYYLDKPQNRIFRDIPNKAFSLLFDHIMQNHTDIFALVFLSAFAGLRPSEACNVRRMDSALGPGITFCIVDGEVSDIKIDINTEMNLRSDLVNVGGIKKERVQPVPDIFRDAFVTSYNMYMHYISGKKYETEYGPLSLNSRGKAITYPTYLKRFHDIINNEMIPIYLSSDEPETVSFGHILLEHSLSPHVFRHWYTVQLVLSGINDPNTLKYLRGDKSPESAITYLQDKSDLQRKYRKVNNESFNYLLWRAQKEHD